MERDVDMDDDRGFSRCPKYIQDKYLDLCRRQPAWKLPRDMRAVPGASGVEVDLLDHLQILMHDYPAFFITLIDTEIELAATQSRVPSSTAVNKKQVIRFLSPQWSFFQRVKAELKRARTQSDDFERQCDEKSVMLSNLSDGIPDEFFDADWSDDEVHTRDVSPSPGGRPPTPVSNPVSPVKRSSSTFERSESNKKLKSFPAPPDTGRPVTPVSRPSSSNRITSAASSASIIITETPSELAAARVQLTPSQALSSLHIESNLANSSSPSPNNLASGDGDQQWKPAMSRPENERTVLVHPINGYEWMYHKHDIKFHVQWELQRFVSQHDILCWTNFKVCDIGQLKGDANEVVSKLPTVVQQVMVREHSAEAAGAGATYSPITYRQRRLLHEVDREEVSIRAPARNEGLLSTDPQWSYGGRITYTVFVRPLCSGDTTPHRVHLHRPYAFSTRISTRSQTRSQETSPPSLNSRRSQSSGPTDPSDNPLGPSASSQQSDNTALPFAMELREARMTGKSFRLARRFGSRRILTFKFADIFDFRARKRMYDLFQGRRFVVCGRVFRPLWAPPDKNTVFAVEVDEDIPGLTDSRHDRSDPPMPTFAGLLSMFNDLKSKPEQAMAKWASRPQLLFSDSVPAVQLEPSEIDTIDDIVVAGLDRPATTEQTLTDGCGFMTGKIARQIGARLDPSSPLPCVVQMRLGGSKGLLILMTPEQEAQHPGKQVLLRKSMIKSISKLPDPSLNIIDVVRLGGNMLKIGASIASEPIVFIRHGGVPARTFLQMSKTSLEQLSSDFSTQPLPGEDENAVRSRLIAGLYRRGGVSVDRKKRLCVNENKSLRVAGLALEVEDSWEGREINASADTMDPSEKYDVDPTSGQPGAIAECLMMAVEAGFDPLTSAYACRKLRYFMERQVEAIIRDFRIPVEQSLSAFIIPDPLDLLAPNEIMVTFSAQGPIDPATRCQIPYISGPVLAYRSPCKLPSDVQKFMAVYKPELAHLKDCIIMSASSALCQRSPASLIAGGDYDGDTASIFWDPRLVEPFTNSDVSFASTPDGFEAENFEKELVKGTDLLAAVDAEDSEQMTANLQSFLLGSILDERNTGIYSTLHDNAVYRFGFDHPTSVRLARMFCLVLDARKSGLRIKPAVLQEDRRKSAGTLGWKQHRQGVSEMEYDSGSLLRRAEDLQPFIMDLLLVAIRRQGEAILSLFPELPTFSTPLDRNHLGETYRLKQKHVHEYNMAHLKTMENFVKACLDLWKLIHCGRLDKRYTVQDHLTHRLETGRLMSSSRTPANPHSPSKPKNKNAEPEDLPRQAQKRALAVVWHERLTLADVPGLCDDLTGLRRLKISCAAQLVEYSQKQFFPLDVDFEITRQLKAEKLGRTCTSLESVSFMMKPTLRKFE